MTESRGLARLPQRPATLFLDFDGVILDSAEIKTLAFGEVYRDEDAHKVAAVLAYQREHGGVSRREKFRYFEREIFHRDASTDRIEELSKRFSEIAFHRVLEAPFVEGAEAFLQRAYRSTRLFVISGTPQEELIRIVEARALSPYFQDVVGRLQRNGMPSRPSSTSRASSQKIHWQ